MALGTCYVKLNKRPEAIASFEKALKISPDDPALMYNIMVLYYKSGEFGGEEEQDGRGQGELQQVHLDRQRRHPSRLLMKPEYWQVRGYCKRIMGDTAGAASDLKKFNDPRAASSK